MAATSVHMDINKAGSNIFSSGVYFQSICRNDISFAYGSDRITRNQNTPLRNDAVRCDDPSVEDFYLSGRHMPVIYLFLQFVTTTTFLYGDHRRHNISGRDNRERVPNKQC